MPPEGMLAVAPGEALAVDGASQVEEEEDQQKEGRRKKESTVRSGPPARYYSKESCWKSCAVKQMGRSVRMNIAVRAQIIRGGADSMLGQIGRGPLRACENVFFSCKKQLYKMLCPFVGPSVRPSVRGPSRVFLNRGN